jgi:gluconolactonase
MLTPIVLALALGADPSQTELLKTFRDEFVAITPGEGKFPVALKVADKDVPLTSPFFIAKYEVPQNLWQAVMGSNPSKWKGKRNSVEMFTYADAEDFCRRATAIMRKEKLIAADEVIRLPSETEWEYCCRAGTTTKYSFGDDVQAINDYAWHTGNAAGNDPPVGAKKPNPWGLYDMHGYLWEFCEGRALRSGSWKDKADRLASDVRIVAPEKLADDAVGLRCVLSKQAMVAFASLETQPIAQDQIIAPDAKFEVVWGEGEFTEGPALGGDGKIYFSDIGNRIYRFDPQTKKTDIYRDPSGRSNGLISDSDGRLYAAEGANTGGQRRITVTEKDGKVRVLADKYEGKRFNSPNDIALDAKGNVYFTDPRYVGNEPRELGFECVFFVSAKGEVKVATREAKKPNGIVLSPDGKWCYVSENNPEGVRGLLKFKVQPDGTLVDSQLLHDFGTGRGIDGMTIDPAGNIYATAGTGDKAGIWVFEPAGRLLAWFATPGDPTNCEFGGGAEKNVLYVTTALSNEKPIKYGLARITLLTGGRQGER